MVGAHRIYFLFILNPFRVLILMLYPVAVFKMQAIITAIKNKPP